MLEKVVICRKGRTQGRDLFCYWPSIKNLIDFNWICFFMEKVEICSKSTTEGWSWNNWIFFYGKSRDLQQRYYWRLELKQVNKYRKRFEFLLEFFSYGKKEKVELMIELTLLNKHRQDLCRSLYPRSIYARSFHYMTYINCT